MYTQVRELDRSPSIAEVGRDTAEVKPNAQIAADVEHPAIATELHDLYSAFGRSSEYQRRQSDFLVASPLLTADEVDSLNARARSDELRLLVEPQTQCLARVVQANRPRAGALGRGEFEFFAVALDGEFLGTVGSEARQLWRDPTWRRNELALAAHVASNHDISFMRQSGYPTEGMRVLRDDERPILESFAGELYLSYARARCQLWSSLEAAVNSGRIEAFRPGDIVAVLTRGSHVTVLRRGDDVDVDNALRGIAEARRSAREQLDAVFR